MNACIHVCRGPEMAEVKRQVWEVRWCFRCRKRLRQLAVLLAPTEPSYYDAQWSVRCAGCGEDHVRFPGTEDGPTLVSAGAGA
jgi:hypothetical protein